MNLAHSQEFHLFCEQEQLQKHPTLDKKPYCVDGTLNLVPSWRWWYARGKGLCRGKPGLLGVSTHQIRQAQKAARSLTSQGSAEPLCAKVKCANREVSEEKADL